MRPGSGTTTWRTGLRWKPIGGNIPSRLIGRSRRASGAFKVRVAEESTCAKDATERTETVRDDVRREHIDVQNPDRRSS